MERSGNVGIKPTITEGRESMYIAHHYRLDNREISLRVRDIKTIKARRPRVLKRGGKRCPGLVKESVYITYTFGETEVLFEELPARARLHLELTGGILTVLHKIKITT
jgi:hypothetical protein